MCEKGMDENEPEEPTLDGFLQATAIALITEWTSNQIMLIALPLSHMPKSSPVQDRDFH
jgi:hypothetical protein